MSAITIREATEHDLPVLYGFEQGVIDAERPFIPRMKAGEVRYYDLPHVLHSPDALLIVAESDGEIVACGYAKIAPADDHLDHQQHALLRFMYTVPAHRGKGINSMVIDHLVNWAASRGMDEVVLDVYFENDSAIKAYEKAGFSKYLITMRRGV